ncbi:MAG TPA: hypothetical protein VGA61_12755 [Anaerolineae bacterium]
MKIKPVLDDWEIPNIEAVQMLERRTLVELPVPGRTGSLYQDLNTAPARIAIFGSLYGDDARADFLTKLRGKFRDGAPVTFVADILTATSVQYVVVESLDFGESGTRPDQITYTIQLRESPPPPPPPDPLGGLDAGLLDQAGSFLGSVTGALDAIKGLGSIPEISNPAEPLKGALGSVKSAVGGLGDAATKLTGLFGSGG